MTPERLLAWRLANQHLAATRTADPAELVAHFGAVQAQEYGQALWAVGLRTSQATVGTVEAAVERGEILRTWPMRGTIHFVAAGDARWMVELLAGRRIRQMTGVYRKIGLTDEVLSRSGEIVAEALRGGRRVRRKDLYSLLIGRGVDCSASPRGSRGGHILGYLSMAGLICLGPLDGRQQTFVLLDEWAPDARTPADPMAELAARYFTSHGPATVKDFGWWSGLNLAEIREAIERPGSALTATELDGTAYWHGAGRSPGLRRVHGRVLRSRRPHGWPPVPARRSAQPRHGAGRPGRGPVETEPRRGNRDDPAGAVRDHLHPRSRALLAGGGALRGISRPARHDRPGPGRPGAPAAVAVTIASGTLRSPGRREDRTTRHWAIDRASCPGLHSAQIHQMTDFPRPEVDG